MILRCPCCHSTFSIEALIQDQAGRELLTLLATKGGPALLNYLTLFRSAKRSLTFDRSLRLCQEVLQLSDNPGQLEIALGETVESLRGKREEGPVKPLKNHNYLKRVLESTPSTTLPAPRIRGEIGTEAPAARSKTASAIGLLQDWKKS